MSPARFPGMRHTTASKKTPCNYALLSSLRSINHGCVHVTHRAIPKRKGGCYERAVYSEASSILTLTEHTEHRACAKLCRRYKLFIGALRNREGYWLTRTRFLMQAFTMRKIRHRQASIAMNREETTKVSRTKYPDCVTPVSMRV